MAEKTMLVVLWANAPTVAREAYWRRLESAVVDEYQLSLVDALRHGATLHMETTWSGFRRMWDVLGSVPGWEYWPICATLSAVSPETAPVPAA